MTLRKDVPEDIGQMPLAAHAINAAYSFDSASFVEKANVGLFVQAETP